MVRGSQPSANQNLNHQKSGTRQNLPIRRCTLCSTAFSVDKAWGVRPAPSVGDPPNVAQGVARDFRRQGRGVASCLGSLQKGFGVALTLRGSGVCPPPVIRRICALPDVRAENLNQSRPVSYRAIREPRGVKAWALFPLRRGGGGASGVVAHPARVYGVAEPRRKSQSSRAGVAPVGVRGVWVAQVSLCPSSLSIGHISLKPEEKGVLLLGGRKAVRRTVCVSGGACRQQLRIWRTV